MGLLKSLGIEKDRWEKTSENFKTQGLITENIFYKTEILNY